MVVVMVVVVVDRILIVSEMKIKKKLNSSHLI